MSGRDLLVDTNIALYFLKGDPEVFEILRDKTIVISFITELELLAFPKLTKEADKVVRGFLSLCKVVGYSNELRDKTVEFRKTSSLKLPDAIIAATSFHKQLPLVTADKQFKHLEHINVIYYQVT
jgi:predicted nucleic acid-binding protein